MNWPPGSAVGSLTITESGYDDPRTIVPQKARGYALEGGEVQNAKVFDPRWAWHAAEELGVDTEYPKMYALWFMMF